MRPSWQEHLAQQQLFVLLSESMSSAGTRPKMRSKINAFLFYGEPHLGVFVCCSCFKAWLGEQSLLQTLTSSSGDR